MVKIKFSLTANAGNLSGMDYESYVQSSSWPSHSTSVDQVKIENLSGFDYESYAQSSSFPGTDSFEQTVVAGIDDIRTAIQENPTAAGISGTVSDLLGEDIYAQ